ncbi:MAG: bacterial proteasome activator family protein [Acidimicrobiales bacterium]|jgi:hypothetical protein
MEFGDDQIEDETHDPSGRDLESASAGGERSKSIAPDEVIPALSKVDSGEEDDAPSAGVVETGEESDGSAEDSVRREESIEQPAKVMRIGSMVKQLLEEVRQAPLDEAGRSRLQKIYEESVHELSTGLSPDLVAELDRMTFPFGDEPPTEAELRVTQAQLVGWLEGLFHGIQATLMAQQMAARAQLEEMRQRGLPPGPDGTIARPGTYL